MKYPIYTTKDNVTIFVSKGKKSEFDFKITYKEPGKKERTPKHIHIIVDLLMKKTGNERLTLNLVKHIINNIILRVRPTSKFPPELQVFKKSQISEFKELDKYGEYSIEFLLVVIELIIIQEKTNYPRGTMTINLFKKFLQGADLFTLISAATFRGQR